MKKVDNVHNIEVEFEKLENFRLQRYKEIQLEQQLSMEEQNLF